MTSSPVMNAIISTVVWFGLVIYAVFRASRSRFFQEQ